MADISIQEFQFTKDWNNPTDFPTFQSNEEQVRADQQELHNQTRDFINDVLLGAVKKAIAENQEYVENAVAEAVLGIVPDKSIGFIKLACAALELLESDTEKLPTSAAVAAYIKDALSSYMDSEAVKKYVDENNTELDKKYFGDEELAEYVSKNAAPPYEYSTTDLTAGSSQLETGKMYLVYE